MGSGATDVRRRAVIYGLLAFLAIFTLAGIATIGVLIRDLWRFR